MSNTTTLSILNVPLENDYNHTFYFANKNAQQSYFSSLVGMEFDDFNYQRKDKKIRVPFDYDVLVGFNYVMYKNKAKSDKWYYAFITNIEYVSEGVSYIEIETDVMQTLMFDYTVKRSFVEREHVSDDTIGLHTVDEGLALGDYTINMHLKDEDLFPSNKIVIGSTEVPSGEGQWTGGVYNGIYSGVRYYAYAKDGVTTALNYLADAGKIDAVSSIFLAPEFLIEGSGGGPVAESTNAPNYTYFFPKNYKLDGYSPKNNILKCYPYNYVMVSNGNGGTAEYCYEYFDECVIDYEGLGKVDCCTFSVFGVLTPGCSIRMMPSIYKGVQIPEAYGLNLGKYPQCNWATDQYTNWLTQNGVNIATSIVNAGASMVGGAIMGSMAGGPLGTIGGAVAGGLSGATQIANVMNEVRNADRVPPQTQGNVNCGDVVTASKHNTFNYYAMSIKKEYAQIIDGYFNMFGYKVNMVKTPNTNHRQNYWYIKTIDVNITGAIPNQDMQKIKNCYNKGITFWKNASNMKDYSVSNNIV